MSIESLSPLAGAVAALPLSAGSISAEVAAHDAILHVRRVAAEEHGDNAAGVAAPSGEDNTADEHQADGRLPWVLPSRGNAPKSDKAATTRAGGKLSDPAVGRALDLTA